VQWYIYFTIQFTLLPKTWLTPQLLEASGLALAKGSLLDLILFQYHNMIVFLLLTSYLIFFVTSLQIGFYGYQFRQLGWTILSAMTIVMGCTGLVLCAWRCKMWFFFTIMTITAHNAFDYIVNNYSPLKIPMLNLKPEATMEGFVAGVLASFASFTLTVLFLFESDWFKTVPTKLSLMPFDKDAVKIDDSTLFKVQYWEVNFVEAFGLYPVSFYASTAQIHIFVITLFIAFISPFGGFLYSGLKRALRASQLGRTFFKGGVIDRFDCLIVTGIFLLIYVNLLVYKNEGKSNFEQVMQMVDKLSDAQ